MSDTERTTSARAIHALATSRRPRSQNSPAPSVASSDDASTFNPDNDDALMSTKHHIDEDDSHFLPKIRTTAQQRRFYNPVPPPHVASSAVRREFGDFDHSNSTDAEDDSIEIGRGIGHTPSKPNKSLDSDILLEIGNSQFEVFGTPASRARPTPKSNLRREAQLRRASSTRVSGGIGHVKSTKETNAPQDDGYTRPTRYANRTVSANDAQHRSLAGTPQRTSGTPRGLANSTAQSFLLPEMQNMTELFGASMLSGNTGLPRTALSNRRAVSAYNGRVPGNFIPVGGIPIPEEEKQILASLQLVKDRLAQVEQEKVEAEARIEEYELHVADLQAQIDAQASLRRSDSALGSSDGEAPTAKNKWKIEKAQLEASTASMQRRLEQAERKATKAEAATKRVTGERDSLATQLSVAYYNNEEIKAENEVLQNENRLVQDQVTDLQNENRALTAENEELRAQFDQSHERHEDETQRWQKKEAALNRKVNTNDRAILQENQTLRDEVIRGREQQEIGEKKAQRREEKARREAERAAEIEHAKLVEEKEQLQVELEQAKVAREAELKRWSSKQAELQAHIDQREETIHQLRVSVPQDEINDHLRKENLELKAELASLKATTQATEQGTPKDVLRKRLEDVTNQHVAANEQWSRKEARLQDRLEKAKEVNSLYRQLETVRDESKVTRTVADATGKRRSTGQVGATVSEALHAQTERDYPQSHSRPKSQSGRLHHRELPRSQRHVSAPATAAAEDTADLSDASTTDLSFDPAILAGAPRSGGTARRATGFVSAHTGDTTYLSYIDGDEIAKLRKRIEEEHQAARQRKAAAQAAIVDDEEVTGYGPRRRSSIKDITGRSRASSRARSIRSVHAGNEDFEAAGEDELTRASRKDETIHSRASHRSRSRRRSSATNFIEMTSAFIIPDITMHTQDATSTTKRDLLERMSTAAHSMKNCSVCQRILATSPVDISDLDIPNPLPVTSRREYKNDIDATLRPSQPAHQALSRVIKELGDELVHLKLELSVLNRHVQRHDPAMGKRKSIAMHNKIDKINKAVKVKTEQEYALFDVLEAHKVEIEAAGDGLPEEVERTLENVMEARGRRVGFESEGEDGEGSEWPGFSDTEGI